MTFPLCRSHAPSEGVNTLPGSALIHLQNSEELCTDLPLSWPQQKTSPGPSTPVLGLTFLHHGAEQVRCEQP